MSSEINSSSLFGSLNGSRDVRKVSVKPSTTEPPEQANVVDVPNDAVREKVAVESPAPEVQVERQAVSMEQVVQNINKHIKSIHRDIEFSVSAESGRTIITVVDSETKQMIRQIPPDELLNLAQKLQNNDTGLLEEFV